MKAIENLDAEISADDIKDGREETIEVSSADLEKFADQLTERNIPFIGPMVGVFGVDDESGDYDEETGEYPQMELKVYYIDFSIFGKLMRVYAEEEKKQRKSRKSSSSEDEDYKPVNHKFDGGE